MALAVLLWERISHQRRAEFIQRPTALLFSIQLQMFDEGELPFVPSGVLGVKMGCPMWGMSVALGYVPFTRGSECREAKESERAEFTVIELSVFCCVATPQVATEMRKKHFYKKCYFPLQTSIIYFTAFPCLCQSDSDGVNKIRVQGLDFYITHSVFSQGQNSVLGFTTGLVQSMYPCQYVYPALHSLLYTKTHLRSSHSSLSWATYYMPVRAIC